MYMPLVVIRSYVSDKFIVKESTQEYFTTILLSNFQTYFPNYELGSMSFL